MNFEKIKTSIANASILTLLEVAASVLSITVLLLGQIAYSVMLAFVSALFLLLQRRFSRHGDADRDAVEMIENITSALGKYSSLASCALASIPPSAIFYEDARKAFRTYIYSGDVSVIDAIGRKYDSDVLDESMHVISGSLSSGASALDALAEIKSRFEEERSRTPSAGKLQGMDSVAAIGVQVFFPLFAGISAKIMGMVSSAAPGFSTPTKIFAIVVGFYIAYSAASLSRHGSRKSSGVLSSVASSSFSAMLALLVFRSSMLLGQIMLR